MVNSLNAAKYFIVRAYGEDTEMTNMKLQKLLYYAQSMYLALYDEPLFSDEIQAWRYGPVCPSAYRFYSGYEAAQLPVPSADSLSEISSDETQVLEEVWNNFGMYGAHELRDMTHSEAPWLIARNGLTRAESSEKPLSLVDMKKLGEEKLIEIETNNPAYEPVMAEVLEGALAALGKGSSEEGDIRGWLESLLD